MIPNVFGSITVMVWASLLGTYTRVGMSATAGLREPVIAASAFG
jgi:hypothetical protein